jgi:predicted SAM-dependent methyltransferase
VPGWVSIDISPGRDGIRIDASERWPLPDGCARAIRSEHMVEHLTWEQAGVFASEVFRVLEPGGLLRICTPDLEAISRAYLERDPRLLELHRVDYKAPTWAHLPNNQMRMWGHRFLFDEQSLTELLVSEGFGDIERRSFGESRHAILAGTDVHDLGETLLAGLVLTLDAVKPG